MPLPPPVEELVEQVPLEVQREPAAQYLLGKPTDAQQTSPAGMHQLLPHCSSPTAQLPVVPPPPPLPLVQPPLEVQVVPLGQFTSGRPTDAQQTRPTGAQYPDPQAYSLVPHDEVTLQAEDEVRQSFVLEQK